MDVVTSSEMQQMDRQTIEAFGIPGRVLMENAGRGAVEVLTAELLSDPAMRVGVAAGRGNNGGDGFVIARYLKQQGYDVTVFLLSTAGRVQGDAGENLRLLPKLDIPVHEIPDLSAFRKMRRRMSAVDLWVDAIFGTGLNADIRGHYRNVIQYINGRNRPVLAVDIPSGVHADTGRICGVCIQADVTATFAFPKIGHLMAPGTDATGRLDVIDIGIPPAIARSVGPQQRLITADDIDEAVMCRETNAHKGSTGHVLVVAGSTGKTGAAAMTAQAALRAGAGLVSLGTPADSNPVLEAMVLEAMTIPLACDDNGALTADAVPDIRRHLKGKRCLAVGPGIGTADGTREMIGALLRYCRVPMVIDADGLNCLAGCMDRVGDARCEIVLTPHPGEMARLCGASVKAIQADRVGSARRLAQDHRCVVVLKGARTVVASPDGEVAINLTGNPGMASGGMGDVLTGLISGLIAQGRSPFAAACGGVYLHGLTADRLAESMGPVGYLASDLMARIPDTYRTLADHD